MMHGNGGSSWRSTFDVCPLSFDVIIVWYQAVKIKIFGTRSNWAVSYIAYTKFHSCRPVFHSPVQIFTHIGEQASASFPACIAYVIYDDDHIKWKHSYWTHCDYCWGPHVCIQWVAEWLPTEEMIVHVICLLSFDGLWYIYLKNKNKPMKPCNK